MEENSIMKYNDLPKPLRCHLSQHLLSSNSSCVPDTKAGPKLKQVNYPATSDTLFSPDSKAASHVPSQNALDKNREVKFIYVYYILYIVYLLLQLSVECPQALFV